LRLGVALLFWLAAWPTIAQTERDSAETRKDVVERRIDVAAGERAQAKSRAAALSRDISRLRTEMKKAGTALRERRRASAAAADAAADAARLAEAADAAIDLRRRELAALLGAMARLTARPSEALAALKDGPAEAAKASLALKALLPEIEIRIGAARAAFREAAALRQRHLEREAVAKDAAAALLAERRTLNKSVKEKRKLMRKVEASDMALSLQVTKLASEAKTLDSFILALSRREAAVSVARASKTARDVAVARSRATEAARRQALARRPNSAKTPEPPPGSTVRLILPSQTPKASIPAPSTPRGGPPIRLAGLAVGQGRAAPPVAGRLAAGFGDGSGVQSRGWVYIASSSAEVFAPYDGRVAYAGPFRGYGKVALIDHGGEYHSLLTGLGRVDVGTGDWVLQGEPLGALPTGGDGGGSGAGRPKLYVEIRKNGKPIDPAPWFARPT
jgi:septal ring factor EnvC (AmiA/AmiB activator)